MQRFSRSQTTLVTGLSLLSELNFTQNLEDFTPGTCETQEPSISGRSIPQQRARWMFIGEGPLER